MAKLSLRDRAFARLLVATVLRRLGQIDALIGDCLANPLPPRAAPVHDVLRLGIALLLFLHTPPHAAVATSVEILRKAAAFPAHKGLVNAVLRRLSVEGPERIATHDPCDAQYAVMALAVVDRATTVKALRGRSPLLTCARRRST